jgi:hypothetical protein
MTVFWDVKSRSLVVTDRRFRDVASTIGAMSPDTAGSKDYWKLGETYQPTRRNIPHSHPPPQKKKEYYNRPPHLSFAGLWFATSIIRTKIIVVILVHGGVGPSLFRGPPCAGARSNTQPAPAACVSNCEDIVTH